MDSLSVCQISRRSEYAFAFYSNFCKCAKTRRQKNQGKKPKFWLLVSQKWLEQFPSNLECGLPWLAGNSTANSVPKVSPRYKGVKMTFSFLLSIYPWCGAPAYWAARHTIMCLDITYTLCYATASIHALYRHFQKFSYGILQDKLLLYTHHTLCVHHCYCHFTCLYSNQ